MIGVERWAEIRRLYFVEKRSIRAIHRLTGAHRDTITRALESDRPPRYERRADGVKARSVQRTGSVSSCGPIRASSCLRLREMAMWLA